MDKEKKSYYFNVIEAKDGKMSEAFNFNFSGHHDLAAMIDKVKASGVFAKDKHAKEFVVAMRLMHHVLKKNPDVALLADFAPQFKDFKEKVREQFGGGCGCSCNKNK